MAGTPDPIPTTAPMSAAVADSTAGLGADAGANLGADASADAAAAAELSPVQRLAAARSVLATALAGASLTGASLAGVSLAGASLTGASLTGLSDLDTVAVLTAVEELGRCVDAARVATATEVSRRAALIPPGKSQPALPAALGCRNGLEVIVRATRISAREAKRRERLGRFVTARTLAGFPLPPLYPAVAAALTAGTLGVDAAEVIVTGLERISPRVAPDDLHTAERALVASATGTVTEETRGLPGAGLAFSTDLLTGILGQWQARLDPDGTAPTEPLTESRSTLGFGRFTDGLYPLRGGVTPELRGIMNVLFDAYLSAHATPAFPTHAEQARHGTDTRAPGTDTSTGSTDSTDSTDPAGTDLPAADLPAGVGDDRTGGEKRADILRALFDRAARDPATPTLGGAAPTVLVHVNATDLANNTGVGWVDSVDAPVSLTTVKQLICTGGSQTVLFGQNQDILRLGRSQRLFTPAQRRAIAARDGGCIIPGCTSPPHWAELHHVTPWSAGGLTNIDNGVMLCWFHHHNIDNSGWAIRMVRGAPQIKAPPWYDPAQTWHPANRNRVHSLSTTVNRRNQ